MRLGAMVNLSAVLPLLVVAYWWGGMDLAPLVGVPWLVAAQITASTIMYLTYFKLQDAGGPTYLAQLGYVAAVLSVAVGIVFLGETYPASVWAGVAVVAAGIALTTLAQSQAARN